MQSSLNQLKELHSNLEREIAQLQKLLDSTSLELDKADEEFLQLKRRILDYTSATLDAAYNRYKEQMPRWSQYEETEKKSIRLLQELEEYVKEQEGTIR
jgi:chromosome segregation ATPase